jgi:hypothetical protein
MAAPPLFAGGIFNYGDPFLNQPIYIYLWIMMLVLIALCWVVWRYPKWGAFKPFHGLYYAYKAQSQAAFIFNMGLISEIVSEREAKCIFDYSKWSYEGLSKIQAFLFNYATVFLDNIDLAHGLLYKFGGRNFDVEISKKFQSNEWESQSSVTTGGIHCDLILDADNWSVKNSPQHAIVESTAEQWNDANPNDQVHAYPKFQRMLTEGTINCPPGIEKTVLISWSRIDSCFPLGMTNKAPGPVREIALEMENEDKIQMSQYYLPLLMGSLGIAALIIIVRVGILVLKL